MGDFSIRCVLSQLPIAAGDSVYVMEFGKSDTQPDWCYPTTIPYAAEMGCYGEPDDLEAKPGIRRLYAHVELFEALATIWREYAMTWSRDGKTADLVDVLLQAHELLKTGPFTRGTPEDVDHYDVVYACERTRSHWPKIAADVCIMGPDFGRRSELQTFIASAVKTGVFDAVLAAHLQDYLCVLCATTLAGWTWQTGESNTSACEQYPSFKWEARWHRVVANYATRRAGEV